ncbi:MAG TPA: hypothetical protein VF932_17645 [Anaerolineae bacterium]
MNASQSDWRHRLRGDPAAWLLDYADNPSVYFWFQRDIVGRPEDSPALRAARERILYSTPVQQAFAAQDAAGFWESPTSLDLPLYRATLWTLSLLAQLGAPRTSRRANAACEFVIQNHLDENGTFSGLRDDSRTGLLVRTLLYFKHSDPRLDRAVDRLASSAAAGNLFALWALIERRDSRYREAAEAGAERLLDRLARGLFQNWALFPSFDDDDALLALRLLTDIGRAGDARTAGAMEEIWARQGEGARWNLDKGYNGKLVATCEEAGRPSKWVTLNVLRVIAKGGSEQVTE